MKSLTVSLLVACVLFVGGCKKGISFEQESPCILATSEQVMRMEKRGTGIILFVQEDESSKTMIEEVEQLAKEVDVPVLVMIDDETKLLCVNDGEVLLETKKMNEDVKDVFVKIKTIRDQKEDRGCGERCTFGE